MKRLGALAIGALVAACAARKPAPGQRVADHAEPFARLAVVSQKPYPEMYFHHFGVNPTIDTEESPTSTFSVDVDTASFTLARSYLSRGHLPERAAVRVEEFINAFHYEGADPGAEPFSVQVEGFPSPNRPGYHVLRLGLRARDLPPGERRPAFLVFAVDTSAAMNGEERLGRVKQSLALLLPALDERDQVAVVSAARVVLPPTFASDRARIASALDALAPEGGANAQAGLVLAYGLTAAAPAHLNRRVIFCSYGVVSGNGTQTDRLFARVREQAAAGVALTTVAFGPGRSDDALMKRLAQLGGGQYAYLDRPSQARRLFLEQATGTLHQVARDVKVQVAFDPARVARYRLLGYESRQLSHQAFDDEAAPAGELGAGQRMTVLYEVKLRGEERAPLGSLRVRYRSPEGAHSQLFEVPLSPAALRPALGESTADAQLAFLVAQFAEKLRGAYWVRNVPWSALQARHAALPAAVRERPEVLDLRGLIDRARALDTAPDRFARDLPVERMDFDHVPVVAR